MKQAYLKPFRTTEIKERLLKGGLVYVSERQCGKTSAILEAVKELGSDNCLIIEPNKMMVDAATHLWHKMFVAPAPKIRSYQRGEPYLWGFPRKIFYDEVQLMEFHRGEWPGGQNWVGGRDTWYAAISGQ